MHTIPYLDIANANAYEQFIKCNQFIFISKFGHESNDITLL